ncbi:N-terminal L-serine N(alpha)-acetyltransferase NAT4 [Aspergillus chevalieri]|uniref:N-alpha-acetyltransferase 40 n=1 Tax=Aspergillus chevalieri TaxID=182096 RepID=A0A7R7VHN3_ASPCH|nr:uncharacterized protein ACHE_11395A [Aspergillus chevalieri]BCR83993.1 hypothetical protein ACHE_11395A [Aspergillus chevalieri]
MPPSVQDGRVTKNKSSLRRSSTRQTSQSDKESKEYKQNQPLPLVERTNALSIEQFKSTYAPTISEPFRLKTSTYKSKDDSTPNKSKEMDYVLGLYTAKTIPSTDFEACFGLIELTSSNAYNGSSMGWSPSKKRKEMKLPDMKYLIARRGARNSDNTSAKEPILGFLSFMVTYEDGKEVIYCYEIHLSPEAQGLGLGRQLMLTCEDIGQRVGLEKTMLTVFKSNTKAMRFYERCGFEVDEYSPQPRRLRNGTVKEPDYLILSKMLDNNDPWQTD